jgi:tetratricopeptide (TPR) repeat protein
MFSYGNTFLVENGIERVVIPARLSASVITMLLAFIVFLAAREMFGRWEALTALAIFALEPSLIGHGSIVLTDMAITATSFGATYALYRFAREATWKRFAVAGLAFGLMLGAKHSAVFFVGILFVLTLTDTVLFRRPDTRVADQLLKRTATFVGILLIAWAMLWSFYGFRYRAIPNEAAPTIAVADYIKENANRPEILSSFPARITEFLGGTRLFPEAYILGMADVIAWGSRNSNIFGRNYPTGKWFYFPVCFAVKSSLPLLLLFPIGLVFSYFNRDKWREAIFLFLPAIGYFLIASSSSFTNGVRHLLPFYPYVIVASAAGAVWLCRNFHHFRYVLVALLLYHAAVAFRTAPNYIAFANDLWGGYENTRTVFTGGNTDLGQSIRQLNDYLKREQITDCWIAGFAHPELLRFEQPCRVMPSVLRPAVSRDVIDAVPPVIEGVIILSVNELPPQGGDEYVPIARATPIALIGGNLLIYRGRFEIPLAAAVSRVHRVTALTRDRRFEEAIAEARIAITLAPSDPRPHLALGRALIRVGANDEAREELRTVITLARSDPRFRNQEVWAQQELEKIE